MTCRFAFFLLALTLLCPLSGNAAKQHPTPQARRTTKTTAKKPARKPVKSATPKRKTATPITPKSGVTPQILKGKTLFVEGLTVWAMNANGTGRFKVLPTVFAEVRSSDQVTLSPDGTRIAFATLKKGGAWYDNQELFVVRVGGTGLTRLTNRNYHYALRHLQFSPDGKRVVYERTTGSHEGGPMQRHADIWFANADGSGERRVMGDIAKLNYSKVTYGYYDPRWSHDGQRILYHRVKGGIDEAAETPPEGDPWSVKIDGTNARPELTPTEPPPPAIDEQ